MMMMMMAMTITVMCDGRWPQSNPAAKNVDTNCGPCFLMLRENVGAGLLHHWTASRVPTKVGINKTPVPGYTQGPARTRNQNPFYL